MLRKFFTLAAPVAAAMAVLAILFAAFAPRNVAADQPKILSYPGAMVGIASGSTGYSSTTTFSARNWANYSTGDLYVLLSSQVASNTQVAVQVSPDNVTWYPYPGSIVYTATVAGVNQASVRLTAYGIYYQVVITPATTSYFFTPTLKIVLK